ncbi:hypothetical protein V3M63_06595 [Trueperella pyogenes]|uniref:Nmad4 family putative nucleotide modification protein n=1 Tax=Trueperella pyogenes TaxID=1661 RepID=UPI00345C9532
MNTTATEETIWTMEQLQMHTSGVDGAVLPYGDMVLVADSVWRKGAGTVITAWVYRLAEQPIPGFGQDARGFVECALELVTDTELSFPDTGHAIAWAISAANALEAK